MDNNAPRRGIAVIFVVGLGLLLGPACSDDSSGGTGGSGGNAGTGGAAGTGGGGATESIVFVTEAVRNANLGGIEGADALCQSEADAAGLEGVFVAWLSTVSSSVTGRLIQSESPYALVDGTRIADDWDDLVDGAIQAPINLDATGMPRGGDVWTGTLANGGSFEGDDCAGFTSGTDGFALCGSTATAGAPWTENITPSCPTQLRVYCVQQ